MLAEERVSNIKLSLVQYLQEQFTFSPIYFEGELALDTTRLTEWVEFSMPSTNRRYVRRLPNGRIGNIARYLISMLIHLKPTSNVVRLEQIRDEVVSVLREPTVPVYDYADTGIQIGDVVGDGLESDGPKFKSNDLYIYPLLFNFRFIEEHTRS